MPPPLPTGGRDTPEIKEFHRRHPDCNIYVNRAVRDGSTNTQGRHRGEYPVNNDDDDDGSNDINGGGAAKMPDGVGDKFEAPLKRGEAGFSSWGVGASLLVGIRIGRGWGEAERQQQGRTIIVILTGKNSKRE